MVGFIEMFSDLIKCLPCFWFRRINSVGGLIGSMFAIYVMGIVYEGLKFWREHLMRGNFKRVIVFSLIV